MASPENSASYHPMILRSNTPKRLLCCTAETHSPHLAVSPVRSRRNVQKKYLKTELSHQHHHSKDSSVSEKHVVKDASYADAYVSETLGIQSDSTGQQETTTSRSIAFEFSSALNDTSFIEKIQSSLAVAAVAKELVNSTTINCSSESIYKGICSDYTSGNESSDFYAGGGVNNFCYRDMSRTRNPTRSPLSSLRFSASVSDSDESEDCIDAATILRGGRLNGNLRAKSADLMEEHGDNIHLRRDFHYNSSKEQMHKSATSRNNHLHSVEASSNDQLHSNETFATESLSSASSQMSPFPYSGSIFTMLRWLFWRFVYLKICEVLLLDTWILSRCSSFGKRKILFILLLLLIPLWLLRAAASSENHTGDIQTHLPELKSQDTYTLSSLFSYFFSSMWWFTRKHQEFDSSSMYSDNTDDSSSMYSDNTEKSQNGQSMSSNMETFSLKKNSGKADSSDQSFLKIHSPGTEMSDEKIRLLALEVFKKESSELIGQLEQKNKQHQSHVEQGSMKEVRNDINLVTSQYKQLSDSLQILKGEISEQLKRDTTESVQSNTQLTLLSSKLQNLEEKLVSFESLLASAKSCCSNQYDYVLAEAHLTSLLQKVMEGHEDENLPILKAFQSWLTSRFISRKNLSDEIASVIEHTYGSSLKLSQEHYEDIAKRVAEAVISKSMKSLEDDIINMSKTASSSISADHFAQGELSMDVVQNIVKKAILLYDADKTGRVDYALESGGGSVISTRCSETYSAGTARLSIFGLPLWYTSKSPRTAIQPEVQPGECWAFHGSQGFLVIQLSATIRPTGFTMEHIPKSLAPSGTIDSAPKEFSVWGLTAEQNDEGQLLGEFMYDSEGEALQYFPLENSEKYYAVIELKILSNWGNQKYTCLYRFRVHGTPL